MTVFFTSDTHFHHNNIIRFSKRPYADLDEMHESLITNWNAMIGPKDEVYHLGDFGFCSTDQAHAILRQLQGRKYFIVGNHDKAIKGRAAEHFEWIKTIHEMKINKQHITLCHYPMEAWNHSCHGSWQLHGHTHANLASSENIRRWDVGVDSNHMLPVSFEKVKELIGHKHYQTSDCGYA